jgi:Zn-dependent peptidase ImmA (M78 family)/DNA-binding XRE family transcriptional regulator
MEKLNPRMVTLARESRGMTHGDLADKLNISKPTAWYLEQDYQNVNPSTLEALSKALNYPTSFFYQEGEIIPLPLSYRKRNVVSAKLITIIDAIVNIYRLNLQKLLNAIQYNDTHIPVIDPSKYSTPQECAQLLRKSWKLPKGPVANLSALLEEHGVLLIANDFGTEQVDAKTTIAATKHPLIVTNRTLSGDRLRFTLAYHLGYLVMHWRTNPNFERNLSHEANLFAAEFLMPEKDIKDDLTEITFGRLGELKRKWKVSMISLLHRSEDIGLTTENQKRYILQQFNQHGIKRREPPELDVPVEQYKLVRDLITKYKTKQKLNVKQIAEFFNLEQNDFLERYNFN